MHCILRHLYFLALSNCIWSNARNAGNNDCVEESTQKPAQPPEFHPQAEATPGNLGGVGGGGAQGFPSPELVLTAGCQGEIPTDALSVRARGVQPTQRTLVSSQCRRHYCQITILGKQILCTGCVLQVFTSFSQLFEAANSEVASETNQVTVGR